MSARYPYNPADPAFGGHYTLTTKDGTVYTIDGNSGKLLTVTDRNGNTLTFSDAGITSSTGVQVTFSRDAQNRIAAVTDPAGKQINYTYDAQGNLASVTDRDGNTTQFVLRTDVPHYMDHVIDPLGRTGVRTDTTTRAGWIKLINAAGNAATLSYDPSHSTETYDRALGNPTTYEYDDRGNIVTEVDPWAGSPGGPTTLNNNVLTETTPLATRRRSLTTLGQHAHHTDPLGHVTRIRLRLLRKPPHHHRPAG